MKIYRVMRGECKCYMACNSYKINDVEYVLGGYRSIHTAKNYFWTISMKFLPMGEGKSSAMPYHFTHYLLRNIHRQKFLKISI